jgi:hypothetical protein
MVGMIAGVILAVGGGEVKLGSNVGMILGLRVDVGDGANESVASTSGVEVGVKIAGAQPVITIIASKQVITYFIKPFHPFFNRSHAEC